MYVWCLSTLPVWSQVVLAKNLPKGEIVVYLNIGLIISKTNIHAKFWTQCFNMLARYSVP